MLIALYGIHVSLKQLLAQHSSSTINWKHLLENVFLFWVPCSSLFQPQRTKHVVTKCDGSLLVGTIQCATSGGGTADPSGAPEFTPGF
jgi:hypothetical protein